MLTPEQLAERKKSIGGSDVAAILGLSRWKTALDVFLDKTSDKDFADKTLENLERLNSGNELEPWVAGKFERFTGKKLNLAIDTYRHDDYPYSHANLDGLVINENSGIELKTTDSTNKSAWPANGTNEIIKIYKPQLMHNRLIANVEKMYLAVCIGFSTFRWYWYEPTKKDLDNEKKIQELISIFWEEHILKNDPPALRYFEEVKKVYPESECNIKVATDKKIYEAYETIKKANEVIKEQEAIKEAAQTYICSYMADSEILEDACGFKMASWKSFKREMVDFQRLKAYYPDTYQGVKQELIYRQFRLT